MSEKCLAKDHFDFSSSFDLIFISSESPPLLLHTVYTWQKSLDQSRRVVISFRSTKIVLDFFCYLKKKLCICMISSSWFGYCVCFIHFSAHSNHMGNQTNSFARNPKAIKFDSVLEWILPWWHTAKLWRCRLPARQGFYMCIY